MNREEVFYVIPYLFSLLLSLGIFVYTWQHRYVRGARIYSWFVAGQTLTILGFILELVSPNLQTKILWDKFQWLADSFLIFIPFLIFSLQFSEHKLRHPRITWGYWISIPLLFTLLLLTDNVHHLIYPNPHLSSDYPFPELQYDFTNVVYLYALFYIYGANLFGISLLVKRALQPYNLHRLQYWTIAIGFSIPLVISIFSLADIRIVLQRDVTPFSLAIGNMVVAWGLFRYGLFDIVPIAREHIVENLGDPVVVLDVNNRVVDINPAALTLLGKEISEVIKQPSSEVFLKWPIIVEELKSFDLEQKEIAVPDGDDILYFDLNISPVHDKSGDLLGRIISARDVTRHKTLEVGYRTLSAELEQRVNERTTELRQVADRYRAVVENQTEFIVRWKPDRTRTFVNEAYCRHFELTHEQAMQLDFMLLIAEEDQKAVEEKITRLKSGVSNSETDIHKVINPDGSIGWQEWTDQAIFDESGNLIEFQSVGRDITQRKQAEEDLRESEAIYRQAIEVAGAVPYHQSYPNDDGFHITYEFLGDGIRQITGYGPDEFHEDLWDSLIQESHPLGELANYAWNEAVRRVRVGESPIWQCEHRIIARNGETHWVYEAAVELRDKDGISHGSIGLYQDITERKQAEDALRLSEERFSTAFQASPVIITIAKISSGELLEVNETFEKIMGYSREDVIGKTKTDLGIWVDPSDRDRLVSIFRANKRPRNEEILFKTKHGNIIIGNYSSEVIEIGGEQCALAVVEDITERKRAEEKLAEAYDTTLEGWAKALELRDKETEGHSRRVTETTVAVARAMGVLEEEVEHIRRGSILHDIGKMGIPDDILRKNGPLTEEEREIVLKHPITAYTLLKPIPFLKQALDIPYCHHEKWDGTGYPRGLKGEEIPLAARIFAIVDVWDALSSNRPYRDAWPQEKVSQYITDESGKHFDPKIVDVFLQKVQKGEI